MEAKIAAALAEEPPKPNGHDRRDEIELLGFRDLLEPNLETKGLVKGLVDAETLVMAYGEPGCGKTFFALDMALAVAAGREWFGHRTKEARVVYVAAEAGKSIRNRVAAWAAVKWDEESEIDFRAVVSPVNLCEAKLEDAKKIGRAVGGPGSADLVIIDTVSRAMAGGDENSPADMGGFVHTMDRMRAYLGCAVIAIHHIGKDASRGARGHSLLRCAVDTEIAVERHDDVIVATVTKQRDMPGGQEIAFRLRQVELGKDQDGDPVTSCVVEATDYVPAAKTKELAPSLKAALDVLKSVVSEKGTMMSFGHLEVRGVKIEEWKQAMAVCGRFGEEKSAQFRTAWSRAQSKLNEGGEIKFGEGFVWVSEDEFPMM